MDKKRIQMSMQVEVKLVSELEAYGEKNGCRSAEEAMLKVLEEFFRDHRECRREAA